MFRAWGWGSSAARGVLAAVVLVFAASLPARAAPIVWVVPSLQRVGPQDAPGNATRIHLYAARGEYESFQIIVQAPAGGLTNVTVAAPDLVDSGGLTIPRTNITLYREQYVYLSTGSGDWSSNRNHPLGPGWYPDALIPFVDPATGQDLKGARFDAVPFSLPAGQNGPIWVDVFVPRGQPASYYQGLFLVTSDQGSATVELDLTVWNFELPLSPALKSCFGTDGDYLRRGTELLRNRLMPRHVDAADERSLIDTYGLNSVNAGFWSGASQSNCTMLPAPSVSDFQQAADSHQPDLFLYDFSADEIDGCTSLYDTIRAWARNMHQTRIKNLITMEPVPQLYDDGSGTGRSAVDIWVLLPKMYDQAQTQVSDVLAKGDQVWSYNTTQQDDYSPKWLLDMAPINFRIQPGFLNQALNLTGLLYWRADYWGADPWADPTPMPGYPGEGLLVYPADQVGLPGVVPSMRLKWLRDGVDDYDYIDLLRRRGDGGWAVGVARSVAPDWTNWTRDPAALEAARLQLGGRLDGSGPTEEQDFADIPTDYWAYDAIHACYLAGIVSGYEDDTYRPKRTITRDQIAVYLARALAGGDANVPTGPENPTFIDVPTTYWAYKYIEYCYALKVILGYQYNYFRPRMQVDRGQMAVFIARAIVNPTGDEGLVGYQPPDTPTYSDVPKRSWIYKYVEYLTGLGIVHGFPDGTYRPSQSVTRDQLAVYLARAFHLL